MAWLSRWRNTRAVRRFDRVHDRELGVTQLEQAGRWAEAADELERIARAYARETRVEDYREAVVGARIRRCEALIRAGQGPRAAAEADQLAAELTRLEGPGGPTLRRLGERLAAAREAADG